MSALTEARWETRHYVGAAKPACAVYVRTGRFIRGFDGWTTHHGDPLRVNAKIYGETQGKPWLARWAPDSGWVQLPNILSAELTQDFDNNGITVATVTLDNVVMAQQTGPFGDIYHLIQRGYLSPWRGGAGPSHVPTPPANSWYDKLNRNAQIKVMQGYGSDALVTTFTGLLDDCDVDSSPDIITLTARDFGQALTDQHVFGWCVSPDLPEPVVFKSLGISDAEDGTRVGYGASASSARSGHPARFVDDTDGDTQWISADRTNADATEWIEIRLPRGRYESFAIQAGQPNMRMFVGVFARNNDMGGEPCLVDGQEIDNGWIDPSVLFLDEGGIVPGATNGGWPYLRTWASVSDKAHANTFPATLDLGSDSVLRIGFTNLYRVSDTVHRASCVRLQGIKKKGLAPKAKAVGLTANASSYRDSAEYAVEHVLDRDRNSRWLSTDHTIAGVTEWVQVTLPRGRYQSIELDPAYDGMEVFVGVQLDSFNRKGKCKVDGQEHNDGWFGSTNVPGANGGWAYCVHIPALARDITARRILLGHTFDVGDGTIIRVAFRNLERISEGTYRTGVATLHGFQRVVTDDSDQKFDKKVVEVGDLSDVVKVVLRWAGFKEWDIETVGAPLKGKTRFNRSSTLMDIIRKAQEATGYVFYIDPPSDNDMSLGIPVFRSNQSIADPPAAMAEIHDTDMIGDIQAKQSDEPLGYIIRVRGKPSKKGQALGAQTLKRVMAVYRPPWWTSNRLAGLIKHVTHTEPKLDTENQCMVMCELIALQEALVAASAEVTLPALPSSVLSLNQQIALVDTSTGLNTRLYIARRSSTFTTGEEASWTETLGGALIDTDDIRGVVADLRATLTSMGLNPQQVNLGDPFGNS